MTAPALILVTSHTSFPLPLTLQVQLVLIINKLDRLILELRLSPLEAYERLKSIIAHVNMIVSSFQSERYISEADAVLATEDARAAAEGTQ